MWPDKDWTSGLTLLPDSPLLCFPQLWKHLKNSLRILFRHFFPRGEWALAWAPGIWTSPLSSIPVPILSPSGTQALSHLAFPCRQAIQLCRQPSHVHALLRGSQEPVLKSPAPLPLPPKLPAQAP